MYRHRKLQGVDLRAGRVDFMRPAAQVEPRRGAAMVEFAIFAPIFLALLLTSIETGRALEVSNIVTASVREGGRLSCMDWGEMVPQGSTINAKVTQDIRNLLTASGLPGDKATISITSAEGTDMGQNFDLSNPENKYRLFKIKVEIPYSEVGNYPSSVMKDRKIVASMVFRAARVVLST